MCIYITHLTSTRWKEYRAPPLEALQHVPQAYLDDIESAKSRTAKEWKERLKICFFAKDSIRSDHHTIHRTTSL